MKKSEQAVHHFCNGHTCAQAILASYSEKYDLDVEQAIKLTTGLAGGMGIMGNTCGTVTGSILVIGLEKSSGKPGDHAFEEATYTAVKKFSDRFEEKHKSLVCKELLECDISQPEGYKRAREKELFKNRCPYFVESAVEILEEIFQEGDDL